MHSPCICVQQIEENSLATSRNFPPTKDTVACLRPEHFRQEYRGKSNKNRHQTFKHSLFKTRHSTCSVHIHLGLLSQARVPSPILTLQCDMVVVFQLGRPVSVGKTLNRKNISHTDRAVDRKCTASCRLSGMRRSECKHQQPVHGRPHARCVHRGRRTASAPKRLSTRSSRIWPLPLLGSCPTPGQQKRQQGCFMYDCEMGRTTPYFLSEVRISTRAAHHISFRAILLYLLQAISRRVMLFEVE